MRLSKQQRLALGRWWVLRSRHDAVKAAAETAYAVAWTRRIRMLYEQNRRDGGGEPQSCFDLAEGVGLDRGNFNRYFPQYDGTDDLKRSFQMPGPLLRYRVALALRVTDDNVSPDVRTWLADTLRWLAVMHGRASYKDCPRPFLPMADYLLNERHDNHGEQLCAEGLRYARSQHPEWSDEELQQEIADTAQTVGEILEELGLEAEA